MRFLASSSLIRELRQHQRLLRLPFLYLTSSPAWLQQLQHQPHHHHPQQRVL